ncbi:MAG: FAD-dependent oxidoreductase [Gammaproteobacteria bacterium]|nr:FAD-dependent oxidoreductase [Gammaproteobacteria bacterium]
MSQSPLIVTDVTIVGGGVAGLWLANLLSAADYNVTLFERGGVGGEQTLASQGMIHGGLKYALGGGLTHGSEAIARMPQRWRACLAGKGEIDLSAIAPLSERYYMFAEASAFGQLTTFFASKSLRGRINKLAQADYPQAFAEFKGIVYALEDFVLDTGALLHELLEPIRDRVLHHQFDPETCTLGDREAGTPVVFHIGSTRIETGRLILCAGAATQSLLDALNIPSPTMQLRPLHQVIVQHTYPHPVYAHCLTGIRRAEPRLTITSHRDGDGWLWYLGGQLATQGVDKTAAELTQHARGELEECVPWVDWTEARFRTLRIDRAEPKQASGQRPDEAFAEASGNCIVCWPTKLSLVPDLGDRVIELLDTPHHTARSSFPLPSAEVARFPWEI